MIRREEFDENLRVLVIPSKLIPKATRSWQNKVKDHDNDDDDDDDDDEEEEEEEEEEEDKDSNSKHNIAPFLCQALLKHTLQTPSILTATL